LGAGHVATPSTHHPKPQLLQFMHFRTAMLQTPLWLQWDAHIRHQNYPLPWTNPKTQPPASSLDPSALPSQTVLISDYPFCQSELKTDKYTHTD